MYRNMNITWILAAVICLLYLQPCLTELRLIQTVFRHGNRNPTEATTYYPNDPYINMTYEPEGLGGLTNTGKMSAYKLGEYFRERYNQFLGPFYSSESIWFYADQMERVIMTGELVAAGMYPPYGQQKWNPNLNWQPIPIWSPPNNYLYNGMFCKNTQKWRAEVEKSDEEVIKFEKENRDIYEYLSQHTGGNITQRKTFSLRQVLYAQKDIGLKLPAWTKSVFPNGKLDELAVYDIIIRTRTTKLKQLLGGIWMREWLKHVDNYLHKKNMQKAFMYAAHELTIAYILVALDNFDYKIPSYSSTLIFELHEENNQHFIQILYKNDNNIQVLKIPGCDEKMCLLDTFKNIVTSMLPEDLTSLCGDSNEDKK
ncbi:venom acid phosphatase Acph-1 isoform X2 [Calliopsis andreniformis]|uniref:venom acid phosphatase Acph-1 isoform X2 n=1 Tax=Calliopsis andreniformis TaxID=337506 RepID=UPI003FCD3A6E